MTDGPRTFRAPRAPRRRSMGNRPMNAAEILDRATSAGIEIFLVGDRVKLRAPQQPPVDLLEAMRQHKAEMWRVAGFRPRREIPKGPYRGTAITAERNLTSLMAVRHQGESMNFSPSESRPRRYSYRFRLHADEGAGIYITDEADLEHARDCLARRYGDRLALVTLA